MFLFKGAPRVVAEDMLVAPARPLQLIVRCAILKALPRPRILEGNHLYG